MALADRHRARVGIALVYVVQMNETVATASHFTEELLYRAELTRE